MDAVIRVYKAEIVAMGCRKSRVPRGAESSVLLMEDRNPRILVCPFIASFPAAVRGAVVDQDDLQPGIGLVCHAV